MADYEGQALEWVAKGEKKLKSLGWFGNKYEEAAECFEKAGNQFKLAKNWDEAGKTFCRLAELQLKAGDGKHDAASAYVEASKAFSRTSRPRSVDALRRAVALYEDMGRLGMAARQLRDAGDLLEKGGDKEGALPFFDRAGDLFATDNSPAEASKCSLRVAQLSAELGRHAVAAGLFEAAARNAVGNHLLKYSAKGYLVSAGICTAASQALGPGPGGDAAGAPRGPLAGGPLGPPALGAAGGPGDLQNAVLRYGDIDAAFEGSREHRLLQGIADALDAGDPEAFTASIADFDSMTRLDPWKTNLLVQVKRKLLAGDFGGPGGAGAAGDEDDLT